MKNIIGLLTVILITFSASATDKEIVKSTITDVTVYAQGAQIYQKANYSIKPGITEVIVEGISPYIDANSLQVKAFGNVIILDSKYSLFYPKPEEINLEGLPLKIRKDIQILEDSIRIISYDIQDIQDEIDVLQQTKNILANNGAVRGQGKVNDSINLLKATVDYYSTKMLEINKKLQTLNRRKSDKLDKKKGMDERLYKLKQHQSSSGMDQKDQGPIHRITVTLQAKEAVVGKLNISYLVANAGWIPLYDLRSDGLTSKINLTYKAQVFQNTGLDWDNVKLRISTNNPYQNKTNPTLHPWYIDYFAYRNNYYDNNIPQSAMKQEAESRGYAYTNSTANEDITIEGQTSAQFVQTIRQLTSAEFKIDLPYSIKSNNEQHMVLIKVVDLDANYKYYTVPKLDNSVYLVAQLSKLDELGLVPAQANIFFDGSYIGETYIDPTTMEDTLNLSMGRDPNIVVKRTLLKKDCKEKIVGDKIEKTMAYTIEIKNLKANAISLVVQDQLPITTNADITIESIDLGKGTLDARTNIVEWQIDLKTKESKIINFSYKVKHSKDQNIPLN
ncbi:MAG: DUF4139 domain-containing protein [Flavobacteriia bacterium]